MVRVDMVRYKVFLDLLPGNRVYFARSRPIPGTMRAGSHESNGMRVDAMLEKVLRSSVYLAYVTVVLAMLSAIILYIYATLLMGNIIFAAVAERLYNWEAARRSAVSLLKVWDLLLIAASFQIMSTGAYKLFINSKVSQIGPVAITSFDDLKTILVSISMVVLVILFLEAAIMLGPSLDLLYFGAGIALVILACSFMNRNSE
jgi:uncharacterized membrane protein YqhA